MRRLLLTADDLGHGPEVDEGIFRAHREGLLRHASWLAAGNSAAASALRAKTEYPGLSVGLHLALCSGRASSPLSDPDLAPGGAFPCGPALCGLKYFLRRDLRPALEREMRAQFERFLSFGLKPSHVDGHLNLHAHPTVFPILIRLCREYGFTRVRLPGGELRRALSFGAGLGRLAEGLVFEALRTALLPRAGALRVVDRSYGLLRSGLMDEEYLRHLLSRLPEGETEIYFHPTADESMLPFGGRPTPTHHSYRDLQALLSPRVRAAIEDLRIELV